MALPKTGVVNLLRVQAVRLFDAAYGKRRRPNPKCKPKREPERNFKHSPKTRPDPIPGLMPGPKLNPDWSPTRT